VVTLQVDALERDSALQEGREDAACAIGWAEVVSMVTGCMARIAGPSSDLDDLTQAALEQVVRSAERFEGRAEFSTYVYRICVNVAMNHWRFWRRWLRRLRAVAESEIVVGPSAPDDDLDERSRALRLHALLERLDARSRLLVTLADFEELPASRIAEVLGCPEPTVRSRLRRARNELYTMVRRDSFFRKDGPQ
jgi:RNA polymerase sigma-70 factor (ECF subfamily)